MKEILMDNKEVQKYLPHRPPFLLIDQVLEYEPAKSLVAIKNVTINEPFFTGHFPGTPVMPGVLIIEALAQAGAILALKSVEEPLSKVKYLHVLAGVDKARFKRIVVPGDQLRLEVVITKARSSFMKVEAIATVDGEVACTAEIMSMKVENKDD